MASANSEQMRCPSCGWEGAVSELVAEQASLRLEDHFSSAIFIMGISRKNLLCPDCARPLEATKYMYGLRTESQDL